MTAWQGTPGPWRVSPTQNRDRPFAIVAQGRFTVAFSCTFGRDAAANAKGIAAVPELVAALSLAAKRFRFYEQSHRAKGTKDGSIKAESNGDYAEMCEAALHAAGVKL